MYGGEGAESDYSVWSFDPYTLTWEELISKGYPNRWSNDLVYVAAPELGKLYQWGGEKQIGYYDTYDYKRDFWEFDLNSLLWRELPKGPPTLRLPVMAWEPNTEKLYFFGGRQENESTSYSTQEFWSFDPATETWTELPPISRPPARESSALYAHPTRGKLYLFGGIQNSPSFAGYLDDFWEYDPVSHVWREIDDGHGPRRRYATSMTHHDGRNSLFLYGSTVRYNGPTEYDSSLWEFSFSAGTWTEHITPPYKEYAINRNILLYFDNERNSIVVLGGLFFGLFQGAFREFQLSDQLATGVWSDLLPRNYIGTPLQLNQSRSYQVSTRTGALFPNEKKFISIDRGKRGVWEVTLPGKMYPHLPIEKTKAPRVLLGGFLGSDLNDVDGGPLTIIAQTSQEADDFVQVRLINGILGLELPLNDEGVDGDTIAYDNIWMWRGTVPPGLPRDEYLLQLEISRNNRPWMSAWPYLTVGD